MSGPGSISQAEIHAYQANHGIRLRPWEVDLLTALDRLWMKHFHGTGTTQPAKPPKSTGQQKRG